MENNIITIGRDSRCDICVDDRWDTVSNEHAEIERRNDGLYFYDHSSNGTIINGQKVHNTNVSIFPGDRILLAGDYELEWNVINNFFPEQRRPTVTRNIRGGQGQHETGRQTVRYDAQHNITTGGRNAGRKTEQLDLHTLQQGNGQNITTGNPTHVKDTPGQANTYSQAEIDHAISKWNWGAFFCSWIWAVCHKMYWPVAIIIVSMLPYIGQVCSLALCVYLGLNGSKIAWRSGKYNDDFEAYRRAQRNWAIGGTIFFILYVMVQAYIVYETLSVI